MAPRLSVVVPTYDRRTLLARTLPVLLREVRASGRAEVIVVVDGSRDGTLEMLHGLVDDSTLRVVSQENRGLAAARNRGAAAASSEAVLFLDDDMIPRAGLIAAHLEAHAGSGERVVFGALALADGVRRSFLKMGVKHWGNEVSARLSAPGYRFRFDDCHFGHASITRRLLLGAGGFDETFVRFGNEDYELGWRLIQRGAEMSFLPDAVACQIYDKTLTRWLRDCACVGMADRILVEKHPALAADLRLTTGPAHPLKRLARLSGLAALDPLSPIWGLTELGLATLERLGARGEVLCKAQSLLGERRYWQGVRQAGGWSTTPLESSPAGQGRVA